MAVVVVPNLIEWDKFLDWVVPYVKGCPITLCIQHIRDAAIRFCDETRIWQEDHVPINAEAGKHTYIFAPPANTRVVRIERAWFEEIEVDPITEPELKEIYPHWPSQTDDRPKYFFQEELESMRLVPFPNRFIEHAITMKASIKPARTAQGVEESVWERYGPGIAYGALATLFATPDKPWSSPEQSGHFEALYNTDRDNARLKIQRGFTRSRIVHTQRRGRFR